MPRKKSQKFRLQDRIESNRERGACCLRHLRYCTYRSPAIKSVCGVAAGLPTTGYFDLDTKSNWSWLLAAISIKQVHIPTRIGHSTTVTRWAMDRPSRSNRQTTRVSPSASSAKHASRFQGKGEDGEADASEPRGVDRRGVPDVEDFAIDVLSIPRDGVGGADRSKALPWFIELRNSGWSRGFDLKSGPAELVVWTACRGAATRPNVVGSRQSSRRGSAGGMAVVVESGTVSPLIRSPAQLPNRS